MTYFVLVRGGMHGAWCWDLLREELGARLISSGAKVGGVLSLLAA
jgi:hypothetical protein